MPGERPDHFAHLREPPKEEAPEDAPHVSPELITYLEERFATPRATAVLYSMEQAVETLTRASAVAGAQEVIAHLKTLTRSA